MWRCFDALVRIVSVVFALRQRTMRFAWVVRSVGEAWAARSAVYGWDVRSLAFGLREGGVLSLH